MEKKLHSISPPKRSEVQHQIETLMSKDDTLYVFLIFVVCVMLLAVCHGWWKWLETLTCDNLSSHAFTDSRESIASQTGSHFSEQMKLIKQHFKMAICYVTMCAWNLDFVAVLASTVYFFRLWSLWQSTLKRSNNSFKQFLFTWHFYHVSESEGEFTHLPTSILLCRWSLLLLSWHLKQNLPVCVPECSQCHAVLITRLHSVYSRCESFVLVASERWAVGTVRCCLKHPWRVT